MQRNIVLLVIGLFLASCSTTEFREEKGICKATWMKKIPPRFEQETYNKRMSRQVPSGRTNCRTTGYGYSLRTTCNAVMQTEYYTVLAVRTVDRNKSRRNAQISSCTRQKCNRKYGNAECKS